MFKSLQHDLSIYATVPLKGIKAHKCNQCEYMFSRRGGVRLHLETILEKGHRNAINVISYLLKSEKFVDTFETHIGEKPNKCNQCNYAISQADSLRTHFKTQTNAACVISHLLISAVCKLIWKDPVERSKNKCNTILGKNQERKNQICKYISSH